MKSLTLLAPAKINLALDIVGTREDGYHLLETVFQSVSIYDKITLTLTEESGIALTCNEPEIPCNEKNLVWKAAAAFLKETGLTCGVRIHLEKHIPSQAGMGGGSSDAASVLMGLNELTGKPLHPEDLCRLGVMLGADVPFFVYGGTAYAEGIGEKLTPLPAIPKLTLVVAKGSGGISTPEAYRAIDALENPEHPHTQELKAAILRGALSEELWQYCGNLFEAVTKLQDVADIRSVMYDMGAAFACMSGSGAAVFGVFADENAALRCQQTLAERYPFSEICYTV
ncbi:MAG: 4-(cytidine 5'-diphospho)-2-C-methyl-D-erythritol kinase [Ruminococcus sp.]|nr:4-(cytidine 5'-diphospho)-2-C-methyl-D-erythritol kinase [Ruminococcus sp.]